MAALAESPSGKTKQRWSSEEVTCLCGLEEAYEKLAAPRPAINRWISEQLELKGFHKTTGEIATKRYTLKKRSGTATAPATPAVPDVSVGSPQKPPAKRARVAKKDTKDTPAAPKEKEKPLRKRRRKDSESEDDSSDDAWEGSGDVEPRVTTRTLRERRNYSGFRHASAGMDPFAIVGCHPFLGKQPFTVEVTEEALAFMDLHAHLLTEEIIGYLAGERVSATHLRVSAAYPGRALESGDRHVELDPTSEWELREAIAARGLTVVGWYHSHPTFIPEPSVRDVENHNNYQTLFKDQYFLAAIVSPYYVVSPTDRPPKESQFTWFITQPSASGDVARRVKADLTGNAEGEYSETFCRQVTELLAYTSGLKCRLELGKEWSHDPYKEVDADGVEVVRYHATTRACKCATSMYSHALAAAALHGGSSIPAPIPHLDSPDTEQPDTDPVLAATKNKRRWLRDLEQRLLTYGSRTRP
eukprot:TRINITY_DN16601_c0_g1_i1.p1 TRINITY_DN16601_c0_g1~~TRINITY_DN16601_c0_g1_i1.p1  ORF type:complete len:472 (+),score=68.97 TRINITY_DN16601_c0_g1_i1:26-1441(+)